MTQQFKKWSWLLTGFFLVSFCDCSTLPKNPWEEVASPNQGEAQVIGSYDRGCLSGGSLLTEDRLGLLIMRPKRRRYYGHPKLIQFLEELGQLTTHEGLGLILVGDLGHARGGPHFYGHRSHQTGLDVDLWYQTLEPSKKWTEDDRNHFSASSVLLRRADSGIDWPGTLNPALWNTTQVSLLKSAASAPDVERIFVTPQIKKNLCDQFQSDPKQRAWLRKIRPWWGHDDHFHVRLKCPENSPLCKTQDPVPAGSGCDSSLEWWFSDEAKAKAQQQIFEDLELAKKPQLPDLPPQCDSVLKAD